MREIKYQGFYKSRVPNPGMCRVLEINFEDGMATLSNGAVRLFADLKDIHLREFTGFRDKNGKEIFEGDICRVVVHGKESFAGVRWDVEDGGFFYATNDGCFPHVKPWLAESVEIIGNIYENPGLMS